MATQETAKIIFFMAKLLVFLLKKSHRLVAKQRVLNYFYFNGQKH